MSRQRRTLSCCVAESRRVNSPRNSSEACRRSQKIGVRITLISRPARICRFERSHRNTSSKFFLSCKSLDLPHEVWGLITSETLLLLPPPESIQLRSSIRSHMPKRYTTIFSTIGIFMIFRANLMSRLRVVAVSASLPIRTTSGLSRPGGRKAQRFLLESISGYNSRALLDTGSLQPMPEFWFDPSRVSRLEPRFCAFISNMEIEQTESRRGSNTSSIVGGFLNLWRRSRKSSPSRLFSFLWQNVFLHTHRSCTGILWFTNNRKRIVTTSDWRFRLDGFGCVKCGELPTLLATMDRENCGLQFGKI